MQQNKIVKVLKSLSAEEMRQLEKFVQSPVHNRHGDVVRLFQFFKKHLGGSGEALENERVFKHLFPGEAFDMQRVHHVGSYLFKVAEEFLAWQEWRGEEGEANFFLLRAYRRRRLAQLSEAGLSKMQESLQNRRLRDASHHAQNYRLQLEKYNFTQKLGDGKAHNLQEMSDVQDIAFIAEKLKNACILLSHEAVSKTAYDAGLLEQVLSFLENHRFLEVPAVAIYYCAYRALSNIRDDESFHQLKTLLVEQGGLFNMGDLVEIYTAVINYCVRRLNTGDQEFMREVFEIYQAGLTTGVFIENGFMAARTYSNVVLSGLRLGEFGKVEDFIFRYKDKLPDKLREGFFNYNLARFHYEKKDYRTAMPLLLQMEHDDVLVTCQGKTLLAKMYFELQEQDSLASLLQSFGAFLQRKKMLGYHQESFLNFIRFVKKLIQLPSFDKQALAALRTELEETKVVIEKEWLAEQMKR